MRAAGLVTPRSRRWLMRAALLVALVLLALALRHEWHKVSSSARRLSIGAIVESFALGMIGLGGTALAWRALLAGFGASLPVRSAVRVFFIGQLGKYLPGSIWPVLAQMELGNEYQVPRHRSASASVLTMLLVVIAGLLTALVALPFVAGSTNDVWALLAAPALLVLLIPRVLNAVLSRLLRLARRPPLEVELTGRAILAALAWSFVSFVGYGVQIWVLALALGAPSGKGFLLALGGFAFAWTVGFLFVIAPAGAGVRDVLLALTLGLVIGHGAALAIALVSRVLLTIGDLVTAGLAAAFTRRPGAQESDPAAS
jgi:glycosyltransferase 2 family protein